LFEHVAAGHVAACSSMLQPEMFLFNHVEAGHVAACSSLMQPDSKNA
jgi:hypothetical protein